MIIILHLSDYLLVFFLIWTFPNMFVWSLFSSPAECLYDFVLIDKIEDVRSVDEDADRAGSRHCEEHVQLQPVDYHSHVFPILANLQGSQSKYC